MRNRNLKDSCTVLKYQVNRDLHDIFRPGESKHEAKKIGEADKYIFSYKTLENYKAYCHHFCDYVAENHPDVRKLEDAKVYVKDYIKDCQERDLSAYSQKSYLSALRKLYDEPFKDIETDSRCRSEIFRGRNETIYSRNFSEEKHQDLVNFLQSTGLRRFEAEKLTGQCVSLHEDGKYYIDHVKGKGGNVRDVVILNNNLDVIQKIMETPEDQKVWGLISKHCNIHGYRADYAQALYLSEARPIEELDRSEIYKCQKDYLGLELDRSAMKTVSESLGHHRLNVVVENYLYGLM